MKILKGLILCGCLMLSCTAQAQVYQSPYAFGTTAGTAAQGNDSRIVGAAQIGTGTWTPVPQGSSTAGVVTCATALGFYYKTTSVNGNFVTADFDLSCTGAGTMTGNLIITGLPAAAVNVANHLGTCTLFQWDGMTLAVNNTSLSGFIGNNSTSFFVISNGAISPTASTNNSQAVTGLPVGSWDLYGQCSYQSQ